MKPRGSTATFEFRNRRRTTEDFVAVEGLDTRGVRDKHVKKPKAMRQGQKKPCIADKKIFGVDNLTQGACFGHAPEASAQSSHEREQIKTPKMFSDPAPTAPNQNQHLMSSSNTADSDMIPTDEEVKKRCVFIQPAETIPRSMFQRGAIEHEPEVFAKKKEWTSLRGL